MTSQTGTFISVVMATYNSEIYLSESIQSVLSQTHGYFELIIVNDNSSDASDEIIRQFVNRDERIVYILNDRNLKQSGARNKAIKVAQGEFIVIVDSDDICLPDRLERQLIYYSEHPECDVLGSSYCYFFGSEVDDCKVVVTGNIDDIYDGKPMVHNPTCMIRRSTFLSHGYFNSKYDDAEDYELYSRWFSRGVNFHNLPEVLYKKRIHDSCVSLSNIEHQLYLMLKINAIALVQYRRRFTKAGYFRILAQFLRLIYLGLKLDVIFKRSTVLGRMQENRSY